MRLDLGRVRTRSLATLLIIVVVLLVVLAVKVVVYMKLEPPDRNAVRNMFLLDPAQNSANSHHRSCVY